MTTISGLDVAIQARRAALHAASRAGVVVEETQDINDLRDISRLFAAVWGRNDEGVPMPSEMLRSLVHADGLVSAARDTKGELVGAAAAGRAAPGACYGYIAAARQGAADGGVGFALKQAQRSWATRHGLRVMHWTFDPLVSRNARFNLTKLGARVHVYESAFYGQMTDAINGDDVGDRLVAEWVLDSGATIAASEGNRPPVIEAPDLEVSRQVEAGPDGGPAWARDDDSAWCRVPTDIIEVRRHRPAEASQWREFVATHLSSGLADGMVAVGAGRDGWYRLRSATERDDS